MKTQTIPAYAKLNLTLDILGKRPDGYHELRMVMQTVSLCDDVTVTLTDGTGVVCRVAGAELPCDERNLAVKAANAFCEALGYHGGIDITLTKRIPSEAGMAGGSADAPSARRSAITAASTSRSPSASRPRPGWRAAARMLPPCCACCAI